MRIQSAISQLKKVQTFTNDRLNSGAEFYETSKRQFMELKFLCDSVSKTIDSMINNEQNSESVVAETSVRSSEFELLMQEIHRINDRLGYLESERSSSQEKSSEPVADLKSESVDIPVGEVMTVDNSTSEDKLTVVSVKVSSNDDITREYCKTVTQTFGNTFRKMASAEYPSEDICKLTKLIWDWYNARIVNNRRYNCKFRYSVKRIRKLVSAIIIAYGYHMEHGDVADFLQNFYDWIKLLGVDYNVTNRFATPFEVYDIEINKNSQYANGTAMVLYDVLFTLGYEKLTRINGHFAHSISFGCTLVEDVIREMNLEIYNDHQEYREYPPILDTVGLHEMRFVEELFND